MTSRDPNWCAVNRHLLLCFAVCSAAFAGSAMLLVWLVGAP